MMEEATHRWCIADREYARHVARRGRQHAYQTLVAQRTALVVVDMVPFFVDENPYARGIVSKINQLAQVMRETGGVVCWVVPAADLSPDSEFFGADVASAYASSGGVGPIPARLAPQLCHAPADLVAEKTAPSAFFPGRCSLHEQLSDRGIDTVIVAGTVANVCCESTVRDASTLGYRTIVVADANAAASDAHLNATLTTVYRSFGDVRTTTDIIRVLEGSE